nr:hypothetical protein [Tanacetum cinerariifolium]
EEDDVLQTPVANVPDSTSKLRYQDSVPFDIDETPKSAKGKEVSNGNQPLEDFAGDSGSTGKGKRKM